MPKIKLNLLIRNSYLKVINNSVGTRLFRNFYADVGNKKQDITKDGQFSCAFFVSSILNIFNLIKESHLTVSGTVKDMKKSGWREIKKLKRGVVIVWGARKIGRSVNEHIGFYVGNKQAISNGYLKRVPVRHHFTYGSKGSKSYRQIIAVFWHPRLSK